MGKPQFLILPWNLQSWKDKYDRLMRPIDSSDKLDAILTFTFRGNLTSGHVKSLMEHVKFTHEEIYGEIIPTIQRCISAAPTLFSKYSDKKTHFNIFGGANGNICFSRQQCASIIACLFFGLFEYEYISKSEPYKFADFCKINFPEMYISGNVFALNCILNYFHRIHKIYDDEKFIAGEIVVSRRVISEPVNWEYSQTEICKVCLGEHTDEDQTRMDDSDAIYHIVGTSPKFIDNMFSASLTYEEIICLVRPECIVALMVMPKMSLNEAVLCYGAEKFSQYHGAISCANFSGNYEETATLKNINGKYIYQLSVIFVDATDNADSRAQLYTEFDRDLNKLYAGLPMGSISAKNDPTAVASTSWMRSRIGGNMYVKFIQLLLAISESKHTFYYYPTLDEFEDSVIQFIEWLMGQNLKVGDLYKLYRDAVIPYQNKTRLSEYNIFGLIIRQARKASALNKAQSNNK